MKHNKYWFKPKTYGYGAQPNTWEGWLSVLVFGVLFLLFLMFSAWNKFKFFGILNILLVIWFIWLSEKKTKGKWAWRWSNE